MPNTRTLPSIGPSSNISKYCQLGPMARSARDLMPLLRLLAGSDGIDMMVRTVHSGDVIRHLASSEHGPRCSGEAHLGLGWLRFWVRVRGGRVRVWLSGSG